MSLRHSKSPGTSPRASPTPVLPSIRKTTSLVDIAGNGASTTAGGGGGSGAVHGGSHLRPSSRSTLSSSNPASGGRRGSGSGLPLHPASGSPSSTLSPGSGAPKIALHGPSGKSPGATASTVPAGLRPRAGSPAMHPPHDPRDKSSPRTRPRGGTSMAISTPDVNTATSPLLAGGTVSQGSLPAPNGGGGVHSSTGNVNNGTGGLRGLRATLKSSVSSPNIFQMGIASPATPCTSDELPPVKVEEATTATGKLLNGKVRVGGLIGTGSYGAVYTCTLEGAGGKDIPVNIDGNALAIKIISKARLNKDGDGAALLRKEIKIMSLLDNPNVVRLHHSWSDAENYYLLMDHAPRGDAFDVVELYTKGTPEPLCARIMSQLLTALAYLHSMGIVHRDVKPENLFIDNSGNVLLGDFGLADVVPTRKDGTREKLTAVCGSETYQAPEMIIDRSYGVEVDLWSAGLTMYTLITGRDPWKKLDRQLTTAELRKKIGAAAYNVLPSHISKTAADLLNRMLTVNPSERITAAEALEHKWMMFADFA